MKLRRTWLSVALAGGLALGTLGAAAQTIKIGYITTYTGLNANVGPYMERAARLYMKLHDKDLPSGVKVELIIRDDGGPNPAKAKELAQELIVRDKVDFLAGVIFTPNALAMAPLTAEAKVPFVDMNAATSVITTRSPYIVRTSFTLWQTSYPLGQWAAKHYKRAYTLVSDYGPGWDAEDAFSKSFQDGGGTVLSSVRVPVVNPDFAPYMQRVKDSKPDVLMVFVPAGRTSTAVMKTFNDLGLGKAGIKLIGPGDITTDEELPSMGDVPLGVITTFHWSAAGNRPANKAFVAEWKKAYPDTPIPTFTAIGSWDGMDAIYKAIIAQKGKINPEKTMDLLKHYKNANSPRGPISIDPETRDIVQNIYLREVRRVNGQLENVEIETLARALKDPWKVLNKKK